MNSLLCSLLSLLLLQPNLSPASETPGLPSPMQLTATKTFVVLTFNIHHGTGTDGKLDLARIAEVILQAKADLVALQEVDRGVLRTDQRDLPSELANLTGMKSVFHNNFHFQGGEYGNAILSAHPVLWHTNQHYPMLRESEQRGLLQAGIQFPQGELLFLCTHLDYRPDPAERLSHVEIIKQTRAQNPTLPAIICGDFNDFPQGKVHRAMTTTFQDCWEITGQNEGFSYPNHNPNRRIDYLFIDQPTPLVPLRAWTICSEASDHCAVATEFTWKTQTTPEAKKEELLPGERTAAPSPPH